MSEEAQKIDFTTSRWGHTLHMYTWRNVDACGSWMSRLYDKYKFRRRYSVMVHSETPPKKGDTILLETIGGIKTPVIYDIKYCRDPRDMYTLFLLFKEGQQR